MVTFQSTGDSNEMGGEDFESLQRHKGSLWLSIGSAFYLRCVGGKFDFFEF